MRAKIAYNDADGSVPGAGKITPTKLLTQRMERIHLVSAEGGGIAASASDGEDQLALQSMHASIKTALVEATTSISSKRFAIFLTYLYIEFQMPFHLPTTLQSRHVYPRMTICAPTTTQPYTTVSDLSARSWRCRRHLACPYRRYGCRAGWTIQRSMD